jgi:hypothetical protein
VSQEQADQDLLSSELAPGETIEVLVRADGARLGLTSQRLMVAFGERLVLDVPIEGIRRIQLDLKRGRPGVLAIVPESIQYPPQILSVMPHAYDEVGRAVAYVGRRLNGMSGGAG